MMSYSNPTAFAVIFLILFSFNAPVNSQFLEIPSNHDFEKPGTFTMPTSLAYDPNRHRLAVADNARNQIFIYGLSDNSEEILGRDYELDRPQLLFFGYHGELYVAFTGSLNIIKFDFDLEIADTIALKFSDDFSSINFSDIALDKSNRILLTDRRSGIAYIADSSGAIITTFKDNLRSPGGVLVGANNDIYVADKGYDPVLIFSENGEYLRRLSRPEPPAEKPFISTAGIALDRLGWVYTLDITHSKLLVYDPTGLNKIEWVPEVAPFFPVDIAIDRNDIIYILESGLGHIRILKRSD